MVGRHAECVQERVRLGPEPPLPVHGLLSASPTTTSSPTPQPGDGLGRKRAQRAEGDTREHLPPAHASDSTPHGFYDIKNFRVGVGCYIFWVNMRS